MFFVGKLKNQLKLNRVIHLKLSWTSKWLIALGLDKQENLSELIGDLEGQLDIEKGVLTFSGDISFNVQILGFFNEEAKKWS